MTNEFTDTFFNWLDKNNLKPRNIAEDLGNSTQTISSWRSKGIPKGKEFACRAVMTRDMIYGAQNQLVHELSREQFNRWNKAALAAGKTIEDWAFHGLEKLAREHFNNAEDPDYLGEGDRPYTMHPLAADSLRLKKLARPATSPGTTAP